MFENAKPQRTTIPINTAVDLAAEHDRLEGELEDLIAAAPAPKKRRVSDGPATPAEVLAKTEEIEALEAQMAGSWVDFVLEARPIDEWIAFNTKHPAQDPAAYCDMAAVIREFVPQCIVEPQLAPRSKPDVPDGDWDRARGGGIWPGDLQRLAVAVIGFYIRSFDVPKSRLVLAVRATFDEQQEQLARSASPSADSEAGNPKSATTTTRLTGP